MISCAPHGSVWVALAFGIGIGVSLLPWAIGATRWLRAYRAARYTEPML